VPDPTDLLKRAVAALPGGGEARDGQLTMAKAVGAAFEQGRHLVAQAGTGTGKSMAYLVPAILWGHKVVVATATKALQDQLARKDLPFLRQVLGREFDFAVLKGRSNYLCLQRAREALGGAGDQQSLDDTERSAAVRAEVRQLVKWVTKSTTGDRSELDVEPSQKAWSLVSVSSQECPGAKNCPSGSDCYAEIARRKAAEADVVVVNMHLYGAHVASGGVVLPEHDAVIFDEAHELEDVLAESLGIELGPGRVRALTAGSRSVLTGSAAPIDELFDSADKLEAELVSRMDKRLAPGIGSELEELLALLGTRIDRVLSVMRSTAEAARARSDGAGEPALTKLTRAQLALEGLRSDVRELPIAGPDKVVWVEGGERSPRLRMAPIDVAPIVSEAVFEKMPVIMTTATVPKGLGTRLGAEAEEVDEIDVGSPFPYERSALLYCAAHLPDRKRVGEEVAEKALHDELAGLIEAAGGRTMALFTSWRAMRRAVEELRKRVDYPILSQEDLPKPALVAAFSSDPMSCLFATMSFWQGVDVPGPTLSLVVIDRIPFPRPDDPVMAARRDLVGADAAFRMVDLPRATMLLAQGAGRLVRTATDRGVVAVLDARLANARSYRWELLSALPPMRRTRDPEEVRAFLRGLRAEDPELNSRAGR
jgi:ATP-dependent DNA helicase DinG